MSFYLATALALWALALREVRSGGRRAGLRLVIVAVWSLSALRYETGYDWVPYEQFMEEVQALRDVVASRAVRALSTPVEPLFHALMVLVKSFGGSLQALFVVVATFNAWAMYRFTSRFARYPLVVVASHFCWIFLTSQMAAVRQSIAVSLILLALLEYDVRRDGRYFLLVAAATGFQYSSVLFFPLWLVLGHRLHPAGVCAALAIALVVYLGRVPLLDPIMRLLTALTPAGLVGKMDIYRSIGAAQRSVAGTMYALGNVAIFGFGFALLARRLPRDRITSALLNLSYLFCAVQLLASEFPLLWARVQYLAFVGQVTLATHLVSRLRRIPRVALTGAFGIASMSVLYFQLASPWARPYIPYQSYLVHLVTGDPGDGRARTSQFYDEWLAR